MDKLIAIWNGQVVLAGTVVSLGTIVGNDGAVYQVTLEPTPADPPPADETCVCPTPELMSRGCKCGAMARERKS